MIWERYSTAWCRGCLSCTEFVARRQPSRTDSGQRVSPDAAQHGSHHRTTDHAEVPSPTTADADDLERLACAQREWDPRWHRPAIDGQRHIEAGDLHRGEHREDEASPRDLDATRGTTEERAKDASSLRVRGTATGYAQMRHAEPAVINEGTSRRSREHLENRRRITRC
jgi:hypothetical protein